jgi:hypothetical protein
MEIVQCVLVENRAIITTDALSARVLTLTNSDYVIWMKR